ncbi:MAG: hypothetical protein KY438_06000, partial [Actinobacteria bacterium]|nr:hypothetical protein [Actinomycetota bacterium]
TSRDYESGLELPGLSTNPLDPEEWWSRPLEDWLSRRLCQYAHLADQEGNDRQAWVLEGTVVGHGPDNEPLVELRRPVAFISDEVVAELGDFLGRHRPHGVGVVIDVLGHFGVALRRRSQGHQRRGLRGPAAGR